MAMYRYDLYMGPFAEGKFSEEWLDECPAYRAALPADYKERLQDAQNEELRHLIIAREKELAAMESSEGMSCLKLPYLPADAVQ